MKKTYLLFFLLFSISSFCQKKSIDSIYYYLELANYNSDDKYQIDNAINLSNRAANIAKRYNREPELHEAYYQLGVLYFENNNINEAITNFIRCSNYYNLHKISNTKLAKTYFQLGQCYLIKKEKTLANLYFNKSFEVYKTLKLKEGKVLIELHKGLVQKANNNNEEAIKTFKYITSKETVFKNILVEAYYQLCLLYKEKNDITNAYLSIKSAHEIAKNNNLGLIELRIINELITLSEKYGDYKTSSDLLKKTHKNYNEINSIISSIPRDQLYSKKYFDNSLDIIEKLEKEKKDQDKSMRFSKLISILSIALICILSLLSFSLYKNNKIKKFTNNLLQEKNQELKREKEKAEQASKARSEFLSIVSHELRTPLNAINGITYLLLQENPKKSQINYLKSLEFSGNYLLNFINDILEINRLESNQVHVEKIKFNIKELINNIKDSFNELCEKNNVKLHITIDQIISTEIIGDPTKLSQILINLINNAIKFTKDGDVWVNIKRKHEDIKNITLTFEVIDNGIGIPADKIDTIFDSFTQGSIEINRTYGGTGLGLSIVKKLTEILNGEIKLESKENKGTTFIFNLSFEKVNHSSNVQEVQNSSFNLEVLNNKTVLLVEDNKINQMFTKKMLENKGMHCTILETGEDAIEHLKTNKYDIVLMDVHLPGINGTIATEEIRKFDKTTTIIALTAISLNENREMLLSYGMDEVITKPFNPELFYNSIAHFFHDEATKV